MFNTRDFERQFTAHYRPLCLFALKITGSRETAEDIVQQLFAELWEQRPNVTAWKAYLYTAVKNRSLKALQAGKRLPLERDTPDIPDTSPDTGELALQARREEALWRWIDELPPARREILLMAKREGLSYREIAARLRISEKTVENQLGRAIKSLRERGRHLYLLIFP